MWSSLYFFRNISQAGAWMAQSVKRLPLAQVMLSSRTVLAQTTSPHEPNSLQTPGFAAARYLRRAPAPQFPEPQ